jgi:hypothetical protein
MGRFRINLNEGSGSRNGCFLVEADHNADDNHTYEEHQL